MAAHRATDATIDFDFSRQKSENTLRATIDSVVFQSSTGDFAVLRAIQDSPDQTPITLVGSLIGFHPGQGGIFTGRFTEHPEYGTRFSVRSAVPVVIETESGITKFLGSGVVPGVGESIAAKIVGKFGVKTLEIIANQSGRLREIPGIGAKKARAISDAIKLHYEETETRSLLHALGLGPALVRRIVRTYGSSTASVLRTDPYRLAEEIRGVGFTTADRLGLNLGIARDDPKRAAGAIVHALYEGSDHGHVFLPKAQVQSFTDSLDIPEESFTTGLNGLLERERVIQDGDALYLNALYRAECLVAEKLSRLALRQNEPDTEKIDAPQLSETQRSAVVASSKTGLLILTGGPGTGKTTTLKAVVAQQKALKREFLLCAPTGRAAKRLEEATCVSASTIHRMLEWNPASGAFQRGPDYPLTCDLVIIDEASMIDLPLAQSLLSALSANTRLMLVGDADQLPPVGAGHVFRALLESNIATTVRLSQIFRQAESSDIIRGSHQIIHGQAPTPTEAGKSKGSDLFVLTTEDAEQAQRKLLQSVERIKASFVADVTFDLQVLTPTRRGPLGTEQLNPILQNALNPIGPTHPFGFRAGDKVMQLRNDYQRDVFNGDLGIVKSIDKSAVTVDMDGRSIVYDADNLAELTLAYASTIHKAQGSEFPAIIVLVHSSQMPLLSRSLLYTAVTRARKIAVIIGDARGISMCIRKVGTVKAHSKLTERLLAQVNLSNTSATVS